MNTDLCAPRLPVSVGSRREPSTPGADYNGDAAATGALAVPPHYWSTSSVGCALLRDNTRPAPGTSLRTRGHRTALPWRQEMRDHPRCLITRRSESELIKILFGKSAGCDFDFPKASAYWSITVLERLGQLSSLLNDAFFSNAKDAQGRMR
jgi:hypothetical protein